MPLSHCHHTQKKEGPMARFDPLIHTEAANKSDEELAAEAKQYLDDDPRRGFLSELYAAIRVAELPWCSAIDLHKEFTTKERMEALASRPDERQRITNRLAGTPLKAARRMEPGFQAALIEQVIESADITLDDFENAFPTDGLMVYGKDPAFIWRIFRTRMDWEDNSEAHQLLVNQSLQSLLTYKLLTAWDLLNTIDLTVWESKIPLEVRVELRKERLEYEKLNPTDPFGAAQELEVIGLGRLVQFIPLKDLVPVMELAEHTMGIAEDIVVPVEMTGDDEAPEDEKSPELPASTEELLSHLPPPPDEPIKDELAELHKELSFPDDRLGARAAASPK
ncbi:MAG: hypothetical protein WA001_01430 [Patescibacteria group bacterium]